jgi:hypothetical protein
VTHRRDLRKAGGARNASRVSAYYVSVSRLGIVVPAAILCVAFPSGCAQGQQPVAPVTRIVTVTTSSTAAPARQFPPRPGRNATNVALRDFVTPSGNIRCTDEFESLSCVVNETDFVTPDKPGDCDLDWAANEIDFSAPLTTLGVCRGDPSPAVLHPGAPTLGYGTVNKLKHGVLCLSEERGLSCWAPASGHGFSVSKSVFAVF